MSNADPAEVSMVVSRDGVTVEKSFEPDDFPVPAIAFVIRSEREESVSVRLTDEVPDQVDAEDIGFHPKYGAEFWSVEGDIIVFEREFEAGEEYTTVYGLRASQTDEVDSYLGEPTIDDVDPPSEDSGQVVRDVIGDADDGAGGADAGTPSDEDIEAAIAAADEDGEPDASATDEAEEPVEPLHLNDPTVGGDVEPEQPAASADADDAAASARGDDADADGAVAADADADVDVVAALARQLRTGEASEDDLAALRRTFGDGGEGSTDARITQLQSEFADLRAYTNALEEFLDENGEGKQLIEDVKGSVERLEAELSSVESRADEAARRADDVTDEVEVVDEEVDGLATDVSDVDERVTEFEETLDGVRESVETVESQVDEVREDVAGVESEVDDVQGTVEEVSADVDEVRESLDDVEELDDRLDSLEAEFDEAREDLQALSEMREQLSSVFGAQVQADDGDDGDE